MSHSMIDTTLPATRRDRRLYRNGSQRLSFTGEGNHELAAALKQAADHSEPFHSPRVSTDSSAPLYTKRDRLAVRSWRGFEGLAVTHGWSVDEPVKKAAPAPQDVQAGG